MATVTQKQVRELHREMTNLKAMEQGNGFALGEKGIVDGCPPGYSGILDEETCKQAAHELAYMLRGTMSDSTLYPGCSFYDQPQQDFGIYSQLAYFNTHPKPDGTRDAEHAGQICKS